MTLLYVFLAYFSIGLLLGAMGFRKLEETNYPEFISLTTYKVISIYIITGFIWLPVAVKSWHEREL